MGSEALLGRDSSVLNPEELRHPMTLDELLLGHSPRAEAEEGAKVGGPECEGGDCSVETRSEEDHRNSI